ncbi:MAG: BMP family ABC transporter substrate-binding protein [Rhodobacterales bacterium]|nr:BMP family ABC transporter substrate-binding protein [Rhodobacterales bacterium]
MKHLKNVLRAVVIATPLVLAMGAAEAEDAPKKMKFAFALTTGVENAWAESLLSSFKTIQEQKPHGLELSMNYTENVWGDKSMDVLQSYAETGEYDVIWAHSSFSDEVEELKEEYPEIMFVTVGSGNRPLGGNSYLVYMHLHEQAYLAGVLAGMTTKTDVLGIVGLFPADDVNDRINGFRAGAKAVNANVKVVVTFIESWYDPAKAMEAANAQVAAKADIIYQFGESFEACKNNRIMCIGSYIDANPYAPESVVTSVTANWQPVLGYVVDEWVKHKESGEPLNAPMEEIWFPMAAGTGELAPYHDFESVLSEETKEKVIETRDKIVSGELIVPLDTSLPVSD